MKLLITGGAGKVGQGIVGELLNNPAYEITVLDRTPGPERGPVNYLVGDIQDFGQVMEAMAGAEAVMHLAAIHNPNIAPTTVTYQTNVIGTFNVHHAAFRLGVKRVVSASSNAIVGWSYSERFMPDYTSASTGAITGVRSAIGLRTLKARANATSRIAPPAKNGVRA